MMKGQLLYHWNEAIKLNVYFYSKFDYLQTVYTKLRMQSAVMHICLGFFQMRHKNRQEIHDLANRFLRYLIRKGGCSQQRAMLGCQTFIISIICLLLIAMQIRISTPDLEDLTELLPLCVVKEA